MFGLPENEFIQVDDDGVIIGYRSRLIKSVLAHHMKDER
jgi:hypothetical protein